MQIAVAFGQKELPLTLPEGPQYQVLRAQSARPLADPASALAAALDAPIGCAPLTELARVKRSAAIAVCDITRPAPNAFTLPPVLERLHRAGMAPEDITLLIATGLHRAATPDELNVILGPEIAAKYRVVNHDARDGAAHRNLGNTRRGTPVTIDERFLAADLHLTLGLIEPHLMLGFSGGRKLIAPGVAGQQTIKTIHSPRFMRDQFAVEGSIHENPLHEELLEIARMARHDFLVDVTLTPERQISGIFAGAPETAHAAGVAFLCESSTVHVEEPVDAVITSAAGYPLDLTFYQTVKGVTAAQHILKPGAPILVVSECREGIGSPEFAALLRGYQGAQPYLDQIHHTPVTVDQWQLEKLALVELQHPLLFYTPHAPQAALGALAGGSYDSPQAAVAALFERLGPQARIAVIPDGPYAFARLAASCGAA